VEEALAALAAKKPGEQRRATCRERLDPLRSRTQGIRLRSGSRDILRKDRDPR